MSCKIEGCTRKLRFKAGMKICDMHYQRLNNGGSYELIKKSINIVFDGSTYKYPTCGKQSGPCDIRSKFINDRNLDLDKQAEELRELYRSQGIAKTNTGLALEISKNCDLTHKTIAKIINMLDSLRPISNQSISPVQSEAKDFRTCAWS